MRNIGDTLNENQRVRERERERERESQRKRGDKEYVIIIMTAEFQYVNIQSQVYNQYKLTTTIY